MALLKSKMFSSWKGHFWPLDILWHLSSQPLLWIVYCYVYLCRYPCQRERTFNNSNDTNSYPTTFAEITLLCSVDWWWLCWWVRLVCTISDNVISSWSRISQMGTISPHATTHSPWSPQVLILTLIAAPPSSLDRPSHWLLYRKFAPWLVGREGGLLITPNMCPHSRYEENQCR